MWLFGIPRALVYYINKDTSSRLEFPIDEDPATQTEIQRRIQEWGAMQAGELTRKICDSPDSSDARYCAFKEVCFNSQACDKAYAGWKAGIKKTVHEHRKESTEDGEGTCWGYQDEEGGLTGKRAYFLGSDACEACSQWAHPDFEFPQEV
jgi:hypothetical protein